MADILFDVGGNHDHWGLITLNRANALNALSKEMITDLSRQLNAWADDAAIKVVLIQSNADKAFCAGGDIRQLYEHGRSHPQETLQFFYDEYRLNYLIATYRKPYVALMNGITMGGGVGISQYARLRLTTERYRFAMPETTIGFFPDIGASYFLSRIPGEMGKYLALTGLSITAADAVELGLADEIIASNNLAQAQTALLNHPINEEPVQYINHQINNLAMKPVVSPILIEQTHIDYCFSPLRMEVIIQRLQEVNSSWALQTLKILHSKCPLSLKVTLAQLERGKKMELAECLKMEYRMVQHFLQEPDFYEGIRAQIIDKDKHPHWQYKTLDAVTDAKVNAFFEATGQELVL